MIVVLGSSPNAFAAAWELRRSGRAVTLVECAAQFGIPYASENQLESGLSFWHADLPGIPLARYTGRTALLESGKWLRATPAGLEGEVRAEDAARWPEFVRLLDDASRLLREAWAGQRDLPEQWRALGKRSSMEVLRLPWTPLRELLNEYFRDDALKGMLAEAALEGVLQGPYASGTSWHLLRRWALNELLTPAIVVGGSARAAAVLRSESEQAGMRLVQAPSKVSLEWRDGVPAALTVGSERLEFECLLCDRDAGWAFTQLLSPRHLETEFNAAVHKIRARGSWARLGGFTDARPPGVETDLYHLRPGLDALEKAYDPTKYGRLPERPPLIFSWPGCVDGQRSKDLVEASLSYLPGVGQEFAETARQRLGSALQAEVCHFQCWTPQYYQTRWNCTGGHLWGGETDLAQSFFLRPVPAYERPVDTVELCGAAMTGDFSGRAGREAVARLGVLAGT